MDVRFNGETVLVTGGSSGIGEACVRIFSEAGAKVFFTFNSGSKNAAKIAKDTSSEAIRCDVSSDSDCRKAVEKTASDSGRIDVLVNNAGIFMDAAAGSEDFLSVWRKVLSVNLDGCARFAHFVVPHMQKARRGKIINISSIHAAEGTPNASAYHSSKAGLDGMTRALSVELAQYNIQVNSIGPGPIRTPMWGEASDPYSLGIAKIVPARRFGKPEEIAYSALFLASPFADYISGQTLFIDGGMLMNIFKE